MSVTAPFSPVALRRRAVTSAARRLPYAAAWLAVALGFSPALAAGGSGLVAAAPVAPDSLNSPYRLHSSSERVVAAPAAPYQSDPRYRLAPAERSPARAPGAAVGESVPAVQSAAAAEALAQQPYAREIDAAARASGLDPALVHAVVRVESAYRPGAVSAKGAVGLMQVLPETASRYGVADPSGVVANLRAGTRHLRRLMERYDDRLELVLAAYNAGEGAVSRYNNSIPPYAETRLYVPAVLAGYRAASALVTPVTVAALRSYEYLPGTRLDTQALARSIQ